LVRCRRVNEARRLLAIDDLLKMAMKKEVLHVKLTNGPTTRGGDAEDYPGGRWLDDRAKRIVAVNVILLRVATGHLSGLVAR
jgi:hypothetical protein